MAARKKPPSPQLGFFTLPSTPSPEAAPRNSDPLPQAAAVDGRVKESNLSLPSSGTDPLRGHVPPTSALIDPIAAADLDLDSFDDYDDAEHVEGVPRLRLLDPPRDAPTVIVEAVGDVFEVSRLRDNGTTVACVMWTRKELEELKRRIEAALETSDGT